MSEESDYMALMKKAALQAHLYALDINEKNQRMHEFFNKQSESDLQTLKSIVSMCARSDNPEATANYWRAYAKGVLSAKFAVSPWLEIASDDDFDNLLGGSS